MLSVLFLLDTFLGVKVSVYALLQNILFVILSVMFLLDTFLGVEMDSRVVILMS